jgi:hypothetical protein
MEKIRKDYMEIHRKSFVEEQTMDDTLFKIELHHIRNKITAQENRVKNKLYTDDVSCRMF